MKAKRQYKKAYNNPSSLAVDLTLTFGEAANPGHFSIV